MKKIISALTALVMTCTVILGVLPGSVEVTAEETERTVTIETDSSLNTFT